METTIQTKVCSNPFCQLRGLPQSLDEFKKRKESVSGRRDRCRACHYAVYRAWAKKNPEKIKSYEKSYKDKNREKNNLKSSQWRKNNPLKMIDRNKKTRESLASGKLAELKKQNYTCPGCGVDATNCPDKIILMSFQKSHTHSSKCEKRDDNLFFWSCLYCNVGRQHSKCGSWLSPNSFGQTCEED